MRHWLIQWLLSAVGILIVTHILPGIQVDSFSSALIAAAVIGIVNVTAGLILKLLFLPFILLTLGLFYFLINGLMLKLASELVPGFRVNGCATAIIGSILLSIINFLLTKLVF